MMAQELLIITGPTFEKAQEQIKLAQVGFDGVELRIDLFETICLKEIQELIKVNKKATMITLRSKRAGGHFQGSIKRQKDLIRHLMKLNIDTLDLENTLCSQFKSNKILCSYHDFQKGVENLDLLYRELTQFNTKIKMCLKSSCKHQAKRYLNFLKKNGKKNRLTMLSPNKYGLITRHFGPILGNTFNYTPAASENKFALNATFT